MATKRPSKQSVTFNKRIKLSLKPKSPSFPVLQAETQLEPFWVNSTAAKEGVAAAGGAGAPAPQPACSLDSWCKQQKSASLVLAPSLGQACGSENSEDTDDTASSDSSSTATACHDVALQGGDAAANTAATAAATASHHDGSISSPAPVSAHPAATEDAAAPAVASPAPASTHLAAAVESAPAAEAAAAALAVDQFVLGRAFSFGERACLLPDGLNLLSWDILVGLEASASEGGGSE